MSAASAKVRTQQEHGLQPKLTFVTCSHGLLVEIFQTPGFGRFVKSDDDVLLNAIRDSRLRLVSSRMLVNPDTDGRVVDAFRAIQFVRGNETRNRLTCFVNVVHPIVIDHAAKTIAVKDRRQCRVFLTVSDRLRQFFRS